MYPTMPRDTPVRGSVIGHGGCRSELASAHLSRRVHLLSSPAVGRVSDGMCGVYSVMCLFGSRRHQGFQTL